MKKNKMEDESKSGDELSAEEQTCKYQKLAEDEFKKRKTRNEYAETCWNEVKSKCPKIEIVKAKVGVYEKKGISNVRQYYNKGDRRFKLVFSIIEENLRMIPVYYFFNFSDGYNWSGSEKTLDYPNPTVVVHTEKIGKGGRSYTSKETILRSREEVQDYIEIKIPAESQDAVGKIVMHYWDNNVFYSKD